MLGLEKIIAGAKLRGVAGPSVVEVVRVEWIGSDALNVVHLRLGRSVLFSAVAFQPLFTE
jgi:hypothetical protein